MVLTIEHIPDNFKKIRFGVLTFLYKEGTIRKICASDGTEILRSIYPAVRDRNWGTVPYEVRNEGIKERNGLLNINVSLHFKQGEIDFDAVIRLEISESGDISYQLRGMANSEFLKNRIGINILHPIRECRGKAVELTTISGKTIDTSFPEAIDPDCPMQDMAAIVWRPSESITARLSFSGDIFEMEDQRNWIDASYKTYSTPLALEFPVKVPRGDCIMQEVKMRITINRPVSEYQEEQPPVSLAFSEKVCGLPRLGIAKNPGSIGMSEEESVAIENLGFDFLKSTVDIAAHNWPEHFDQSLAEANRIRTALFLEIFLPEKSAKSDIEDLLKKIQSQTGKIERIGLFNKSTSTSEGFAVTDLAQRIRAQFPEIKLEGGSFGYHAELNRSKVDASFFDYITFTVSPQVHAFDDMSLVENLEGLAEVVKNIGNKYGLPVSVGAISLRQRMNFVTTVDQEIPTDRLPDRVDTRQPGIFAAMWTLGALKQLIATDAESAVFYECSGQCGIMNGLNPEKGFGQFPEKPLHPYPIFGVFREILSLKSCILYTIYSSDYESVDGITVELENHQKFYCWNYAAIPKKIVLPGEKTETSDKCFAYNFEHFQWKETAFNGNIPGYGFLFFYLKKPDL